MLLGGISLALLAILLKTGNPDWYIVNLIESSPAALPIEVAIGAVGGVMIAVGVNGLFVAAPAGATVLGKVVEGGSTVAKILPVITPVVTTAAVVATVALVPPRTTDLVTPPEETQQTLEYAEGEKWDGKAPERYQEPVDYTENIEIQGYVDMLVTADHPLIPLINSDVNTVYQQYVITRDGELLFDSKLIAPGDQVNWNAYEALPEEAGRYEVVFQINNYDLETKAVCNGADQQVNIDKKL
jgi:hypothetical protein